MWPPFLSKKLRLPTSSMSAWQMASRRSVMDDERFETWVRALEDGISRRGVLGVLSGLGVAMAPSLAGAKRGKQRTRKASPASSGSRASTASKPAPTGQGRYQTLAAKWWAWAIDEGFAPILDDGAVDCAAGQQGKTWFLAGSFFNVGAKNRTCAIPQGTQLFFPVLNQFCGELPATFTMQLHELRACAVRELAKAIADFGVDVDSLTATVDGKTALLVRAQSALFPLHLGEPNVFEAPPGTYLEAADGYWVLLDPLPPGKHFVHIVADPVIDVTYEITVV
jgi:hypothetical protein